MVMDSCDTSTGGRSTEIWKWADQARELELGWEGRLYPIARVPTMCTRISACAFFQQEKQQRKIEIIFRNGKEV
jgi:hypothetical protein